MPMPSWKDRPYWSAGEISLYRKNGNYRIIVKEVQQIGLGELYARFERIRARLDKLGVFDEARKRKLPPYPRKIAVVTSAQGAAIQDIRNIAQRRNPQVKLVLYPVKVQGPDAPADIVRGIEYFNENSDADILIVGRGGGSAEDLAAFNEEAVVMSVYRSRIPVVSAVGHETDFTLCDMAADLRAPTPSRSSRAMHSGARRYLFPHTFSAGGNHTKAFSDIIREKDGF